MIINLRINHLDHALEVNSNDRLLDCLRKLGYLSVKSGGCVRGECGACTVLMDGVPINSCMFLAIQAENHEIETVEAMGEHPDQGWKKTEGLDILQQAFIDVGAIQCGYCTPAMLMAAQSLLKDNPDPDEQQVRDQLSGILCRCTAYAKPVQAILRAAAIKRGENLTSREIEKDPNEIPLQNRSENREKISHLQVVGHPEPKVDAIKLVQGKAAFTEDISMPGLLHAKVLRSNKAHALIKHIDTSKAKAIPGVVAVLTWEDLPRVVYSTAGQSDPIPGPLDTFSLDKKVRFMGDRIAFIAAENVEIAESAMNLIDVEYEELPVLLDSGKAMDIDAPCIHDEFEYVNFADSDASRNLAASIRIDIGDVEKGFREADRIFEADYEVPKVQQAHIEPHVAMTWWDEDDRLVIRTSTQVPFHVRRQLAPVLGLPIKRIRVIKPRIGGGFGGKQEVLIEDVAAHLTIATGRPVCYAMNREEEFIAARSRHPMHIKMRTGIKNDGTITANEMYALSDTGAYGCHALTVTGNTGHKSMALYVGDEGYRKSPNIRFYADIVYTNTPPSGAYRGYGVPQGFWPVERHMETIARSMGFDPLKFRLKNSLRPGELHPFSTAWSEGREPQPEIIASVGLEDCVEKGKAAISWDEKYGNERWHQVEGKPKFKRGIGVALVMQGTAIPYLDMGGASIKMNDDGSFIVLVGATDLGTGSDTILAQMAAEILGVPLDDIIIFSSDTDFTPFDKGAYASSTTYISGQAVIKAAQLVADKIKERAVQLFSEKGILVKPGQINLQDQAAFEPGGERISLEEIALDAIHHKNQEEIMAVASHMSHTAPPPFAAQFAEVSVDTETGCVTVENLVMAVDSGFIINPVTATGQIEGGMAQALGYATCEEMVYDECGRARERDLVDYHIFRADEMPKMKAIFVDSYEPTHPFGAKAVAEIPMDGVAPAVGNAIMDACGISLKSIPALPEKVWQTIKNKTQQI